MTHAYDFGMAMGAEFEKEALPLGNILSAARQAVAPATTGFSRAMAQGANPVSAAARGVAGQVMSSPTGRAAVGAGKQLASDAGAAVSSAAQKAFAPGIKGYERAISQGATPAFAAGRALKGQVMSSGVGRGAVGAAEMLANAPEATGRFMTNAARRAGNLMDPAGRAGSAAMDAIGASRRSGNLTNKLIGGGTLAGGYVAGKNYLGGGEAGAGAGAAPAAMAGGSTGGAGGGEGLMGMWNSLPMEARYAIGAGVPLALAGGLMGMRGNTGAGLGLGALGLGAAGLGAAGSGVFGDGARRMVGQGANSLYGMIGGGGGDMRSQLNALKGLSPEFGTTMLMGKDPTGKLTSEQARGAYDFLTSNPAASAFLPGIENASVRPGSVMKAGAALAEKLSERRCWKGYEAVPGVKPFSRGSCRPVNAQKDTKNPKPTAAGDSDSDAGSEKNALVGSLIRGGLRLGGQAAQGVVGASGLMTRGVGRAMQTVGSHNGHGGVGKLLTGAGQAVHGVGAGLSTAAKSPVSSGALAAGAAYGANRAGMLPMPKLPSMPTMSANAWAKQTGG